MLHATFSRTNRKIVPCFSSSSCALHHRSHHSSHFPAALLHSLHYMCTPHGYEHHLQGGTTAHTAPSPIMRPSHDQPHHSQYPSSPSTLYIALSWIEEIIPRHSSGSPLTSSWVRNLGSEWNMSYMSVTVLMHVDVISHTFTLLIRSSGCQIRSDLIHRSVPDPLR